MREEIKHGIAVVKHAAESISHSPSTAWFMIPLAYLQAWWVQWGSEVTDALTSFLGLVLLIVLIRFHLHKTNQIIKQNRRTTDE